MNRKINLRVGFFYIISWFFGADANNLCKKTAAKFAVGVCEKEFVQLCCPPVGAANATRYALDCSKEIKSFACRGGFYRSNDNSVLPCPDGYFCPPLKTCMLPCPIGSYCKRSRPDPILNQSSAFVTCRRDDTVIQSVDVGSRWSCPGETAPIVCEKGFFCSTTKTKKICPKGYFCRYGTTAPQKCTLSISCKQKGQSSLTIDICILIGTCTFTILAFVYLISAHQKSMTKYIRKRINQVHPSTNTHVAILPNITFSVGISQPAVINVGQETDKVSIQFEDLKYKSDGKEILKGVNGEFEAGSLTTVLGPSGGGKSTLLKALSGKIPTKSIKGNIIVNGSKVNSTVLRDISGFVPQDDVMHSNLTPREIITFQGMLRSKDSRKIIHDRVSKVLEILDITNVQHSIICDRYGKGLSGGQRKRVNIGMELIAEPPVLFLDEPTSGLDSATSLLVMKILLSLAKKGLTIICVLHQPRYEVFMMANSILFLSKDGRVIFQGTQSRVIDFFSTQGIITPTNVNPADYFMDYITRVTWKNDAVNEEYNCSVQHREIKQSPGAGQKELRKQSIVQPGFASQLWVILSRQFLLQWRNAKIIILNYLLSIVAGLFHAIMYKEVDFVQVLSMAVMSNLIMGATSMLISVRQFTDNRKELLREVNAGVRVTSYYLAVEISYLPHMILLPLAYFSLNYPIVFPRASFKDYYFLGLIVYFSTSGFSFLASVIMHPQNAQMAAVVYGLVCCLFSGTIKSICEMYKLPIVGWLVCSLSYSRWSVEYIFNLEQNMINPVLRPAAEYFRYSNDYPLDNLSLCLTVMIVIGLAYRVVAFLVFKFIVCKK